MTDIFSDDIKELIKLATTYFDKFYKETEKKSKSSGYSSKAASSGDSSTAASSSDYSTAASSGDYSTAASSGYSSKAASSGYYSTAASSGDYSTAASSGYYSKAASSGDSSKAASSGNSSKAASSGNSSKAASSGNSSTAASSGNYSKAASSGNYSTAASSGDYSTAASSGYSSKAASSGDSSTAASSGDYSKAASSGNSSTAASSGNSSTAASSGNYSKAASSGENSACSALGYRSAVKGDIGNLLMCSEFDKDNKPVGGLCAIVDGKTIKAGAWYIVQNMQWVEVDFTDNVFSYVLSNKGKVKKIKYENGNEGYVVTDGNLSAHGKTIKEARDDLAFKLMSRDVEQFKKMPLSTTKTADEWALVYRAVTGACRQGTEQFMKSRNLKDKYTLKEILKETEGAYGFDKFKEIVRG